MVFYAHQNAVSIPEKSNSKATIYGDYINILKSQLVEPSEPPGVQRNGDSVSAQYYKLCKIILATTLFYFSENTKIKFY